MFNGIDNDFNASFFIYKVAERGGEGGEGGGGGGGGESGESGRGDGD
jgi:hypothetical protein